MFPLLPPHTSYTLHCCGLLTAASISPPPLCWHGTEVGGGDTWTDGNIGRSNFSESFPATFLSFDSFTLLYRIQRRQKEDWKQIVFVYTELLKLSKTTLTFFWLVEICLQKFKKTNEQIVVMFEISFHRSYLPEDLQRNVTELHSDDMKMTGSTRDQVCQKAAAVCWHTFQVNLALNQTIHIYGDGCEISEFAEFRELFCRIWIDSVVKCDAKSVFSCLDLQLLSWLL